MADEEKATNQPPILSVADTVVNLTETAVVNGSTPAMETENDRRQIPEFVNAVETEKKNEIILNVFDRKEKEKIKKLNWYLKTMIYQWTGS